MEQSSYFSALKYGYNDEWILRIDESDFIIDIEVRSEDWQHIMHGVWCWNDTDSNLIVKN